jgi:hypothetical protein
MGRWGNYAKATPQNGGKYIKLKDGDTVKFAVTDAAVGKQTTWWLEDKDGQRKKVAENTPGAEMNTKMVLCVYDLDQQCMRVLQITPNTFRTLSEKVDEFGENRAYRIKRYRDQKNFVSYAIDNIDRLDAEVVERIAREQVIDILAENDVSELEVAAETPAPAKRPSPTASAAEKPRTPNTRTTSAMPPASMPEADEEVPF